MKLKGKFYRTSILPALFYGIKYWITKQMYIDKMGVAGMLMYGKTLSNQIPNNTKHAQLMVVSIEERIWEHKLH